MRSHINIYKYFQPRPFLRGAGDFARIALISPKTQRERRTIRQMGRKSYRKSCRKCRSRSMGCRSTPRSIPGKNSPSSSCNCSRSNRCRPDSTNKETSTLRRTDRTSTGRSMTRSSKCRPRRLYLSTCSRYHTASNLSLTCTQSSCPDRWSCTRCWSPGWCSRSKSGTGCYCTSRNCCHRLSHSLCRFGPLRSSTRSRGILGIMSGNHKGRSCCSSPYSSSSCKQDSIRCSWSNPSGRPRSEELELLSQSRQARAEPTRV